MHRNPVKRGLVAEPQQWDWSSYRHYADGERGIVLVNEERKAELKVWKIPAGPGSVVPSFAKSAKLGQPLSPMCRRETLETNQHRETTGGTGVRGAQLCKTGKAGAASFADVQARNIKDAPALVKRPARLGSVVPSFAKPAKLGQPLSSMCRRETLKTG
jgi:hypothetical protein